MSLESDLRDLSELPIFAVLEREALRLLAFSADVRKFSAGETIFEAGKAADCGYFLIEGAVELTDAERVAPGRVVRAPALLGEMALITETERSATAVAAQPATTLCFSRALFQRVLREHPRSARALQSFVESRLTAFASDLRSASAAFSTPEDL